MTALKEKLEYIYDNYNKKFYVNPDPLLFLYNYEDTRDREIAGIVAASLAYGRVEMIMKTVGQVLETMGPSPFSYLTACSDSKIQTMFRKFKYRFANQEHLCSLLLGIKKVLGEYGSLESCFAAGMSDNDETVLPGLVFLCRQINPYGQAGHLLADPCKTSACKRSHLFLRWMVRKDAVDPGGWDRLSSRQLMIPLDTHMYKVGKFLGFTRRKSPDRSAVIEITAGFRRINGNDPVKYDFSLTRFGIQRDLDMDDLESFLLSGKQD